MWFSLFLLIFYTLIVGGTVLIVTKLIKKWSDKHVIVSKDDLYSFGLEKPKSIEKKETTDFKQGSYMLLSTGLGTNADGVFPLKLRIGGIDSSIEQLNEILRTPTDFCNPTVPLKTEMVECINSKGKTDPVLIMPIEASAQLHVNQADEAYLRERINAHIAASRVLNTLMLKDMLKHGTMLLCRTIRREWRILDSALLSLDFLYYESN